MCVDLYTNTVVQKQAVTEPAVKTQDTNRKLRLKGKVCGQCEVQLAGLVSPHAFHHTNHSVINLITTCVSGGTPTDHRKKYLLPFCLCHVSEYKFYQVHLQIPRLLL